MALEDAQIRQVLLYVFSEGLPIIKADQNGNEPPKPYITYKIRNTMAVGHDEPFEVDELGFRDVSGNRWSAIEVNFYGANASAQANKFYNALGLETVIDHASFLGVEISERLRVVDLTEVQEMQKTPRMMVEFNCIWKSLTNEEVQFITDLEVVYATQGSFLFERTFQIAT